MNQNKRRARVEEIADDTLAQAATAARALAHVYETPRTFLSTRLGVLDLSFLQKVEPLRTTRSYISCHPPATDRTVVFDNEIAASRLDEHLLWSRTPFS